MTTTIDVAALHAIYAGPYTAPDGTTRRGLLERCPAAFPRFVVQGCHQEVNAALCRITVEDWLTSELHFTAAFTQNSVISTVTLRGGDFDPGSFETTFDGRTIHHALVAAAHAVLDAQGVPA